MDDVLAAIMDATRRRILDLLREQSRSAGDIARYFPDMSRPAVSQHLAVLRDAGLVHVRREGRHVVYSLCADPLRTVWDEWLGAYANLWSRRLTDLKRVVESQSPARDGFGEEVVDEDGSDGSI